MFSQKCNKCNVKMKSITANFKIDIDGVKKKFINVPAKQCSECGNVEPNDFVMDRLKKYAHDYPIEPIDFIKCENEEGTAANSMFF